MRYLYLFIGIFFLSCQSEIKYPEGGFLYPKKILPKDTNQYFYSIKDSGTKQETFNISYAYLFYKPFNEPNLSIRPLSKETFRFVYSDAFRYTVIIRFNRDSLIVKQIKAGELYLEDTSRLSSIENLHYRILRSRYPINIANHRPSVKRYLDSMTKLYPQLLQESYYRRLYERLIIPDSSFAYSEKKIALTNEQFVLLVNEINSSGFWQMPYQLPCLEPSMDGYGFSLEGNTNTAFKVVFGSNCSNRTNKFTKACQGIVHAAGVDKEIGTIWRKNPVDSIVINPVELDPLSLPKNTKKK